MGRGDEEGETTTLKSLRSEQGVMGASEKGGEGLRASCGLISGSERREAE